MVYSQKGLPGTYKDVLAHAGMKLQLTENRGNCAFSAYCLALGYPGFACLSFFICCLFFLIYVTVPSNQENIQQMRKAVVDYILWNKGFFDFDDRYRVKIPSCSSFESRLDFLLYVCVCFLLCACCFIFLLLLLGAQSLIQTILMQIGVISTLTLHFV